MFVSLAHPLDVSFSNDIHIMEDSLNLNTPLTLIFLVFVFWIPMQVLDQFNYIIPSRKKDCCTSEPGMVRLFIILFHLQVLINELWQPYF